MKNEMLLKQKKKEEQIYLRKMRQDMQKVKNSDKSV